MAQKVKTGSWQGTISYDQAVIPFTLITDHSTDGTLKVTLVNGPEKIIIHNTHWKEDSLVIPMHAFDAEIIVKVATDKMLGRWVKNYKINASQPFKAELNKQRFAEKRAKSQLKIPAKLKMTLTPGGGMAYEALGLFDHKNNILTGTIMTEVGDFRYFEGVIQGDSIFASSFDGVHAFLLEGKKTGDVWSGRFVMDNNYSEAWTGIDDPAFELSEPF